MRPERLLVQALPLVSKDPDGRGALAGDILFDAVRGLVESPALIREEGMWDVLLDRKATR